MSESPGGSRVSSTHRVHPTPRLRRVRRAFTILELMIVLAVILGISGILLPLALDDAKRAATGEAASQLEALLLSTRAEAQRTGRALRIVAVLDPAGPSVRVEELSEQAMAGGTARVLQESTLPDGLKLGRSRDEVEGVSADSSLEPGWIDDEEFAPTDDPAGFNDAPPPAPRLQLAVFLPDGHIAPTRPLYLRGPDGRVGQLDINSWTGVLTVTYLAPRTDDDPDSPDADAGYDAPAEPPPLSEKPARAR